MSWSNSITLTILWETQRMLTKVVKTRIYTHKNCTHKNTYIYRNITLKWVSKDENKGCPIFETTFPILAASPHPSSFVKEGARLQLYKAYTQKYCFFFWG